MKAITIHQPWATLIAVGEKRFETRGWSTRYRGPIAIHAGRHFNKEAWIEPPIYDAIRKHGLLLPEDFPAGAVVAIADLVGCYRIYDTIDNGIHIVRCPNDQYDFDKAEFIRKPESDFGFFEEGRYAWELDNVQMLPEPIPSKGQQGLWNWEGDKH
ncbi:hypothetical protein J41TS12_10890 [Paenibacillus antibioticophila]|uniref:ASCH domain-containing protein n=1 Tax=Paenibacillus antibioticophila TaxID=1274374 RepID=A0A919XTS4_9BACL|nr:ASCH domain-containing protein [Paenibacillus antibioticophila]GIO36228.1 hypothetical protein J41TS12_10890 [Paenibacillus antibioticophila]